MKPFGLPKSRWGNYLKSSSYIKTSKKIFESGELEPNSVISILETINKEAQIFYRIRNLSILEIVRQERKRRIQRE